MKKLLSVLIVVILLFNPALAKEESSAEKLAAVFKAYSENSCAVYGNTVVLYMNIKGISNIEIPTGEKIILDMGDNGIRGNRDSNAPVIIVPEGAEIEIANGTLSAEFTGADDECNYDGSVAIENRGILKLKNVTVRGGYPGDISGKGGSAIVNSGTLEAINTYFNGGDSYGKDDIGGTGIENSGYAKLDDVTVNGGWSESFAGGMGITNSGELVLEKCNICGGTTRNGDGGIAIENTGVLEASDNTYIDGGGGAINGGLAVKNEGSANFEECNIQGGIGSEGSSGGGILNTSTLTLKNGRVEGFMGNRGIGKAGIENRGDLLIDGTAIFGGWNNSEYTNCGNGIDNFGMAVMKAGSVKGGNDKRAGHGVYNGADATFTLYDGEIYGGDMTAYGVNAGNAIYNEGTLLIEGGVIVGGSYDDETAGIYSTIPFTINGGRISGGLGDIGGKAVIVETGEEAEYGFILNGGVLEGGFGDEICGVATSNIIAKNDGITLMEKDDENGEYEILFEDTSEKRFVKAVRALTLSKLSDEDGKHIILINSSVDISDKNVYMAAYDKYGKVMQFKKAVMKTEFTYKADISYSSDIYTVKIFVFDSIEAPNPLSGAEVLVMRE